MKAEHHLKEKDGCAIVAIIDKHGRSTHAIITRAVEALRRMGHRSGDIHGEGDGCGIATDIPREIWSRRLAGAGLSPHLAESRNFFIGHFLFPKPLRSQAPQVVARLRSIFAEHGAELLCDVQNAARESELGPRARRQAPFFWQAAGMIGNGDPRCSGRNLFSLQMAIEQQLPEVHIASLSLDSAVYKLQGIADLLPRVFPELLDEHMRSGMVLGHSRYSTNTLPSVTMSQPFSILCHNGEINTIDRLRDTGRAMSIPPMPVASDSQGLNRVMEGLIHLHGLDIMEALEMVFPPIYSEMDNYPAALQEMYAFYRWFFPCSAQGPAAVVARYGDLCLGSVDALGLRPLWFVESDYDYLLSSEKGVVNLQQTVTDPRPLAPGEKIAIVGGRGRRAEILNYDDYQRRLLQLPAGRPRLGSFHASLYSAGEVVGTADGKEEAKGELPWRKNRFASAAAASPETAEKPDTGLLGAFGWQYYDLMIRQRVSGEGREVIGSLGHTGPLAAFVPESLPNIADFFKENVAVVTNPAIDRERESAHFTTRVVLGARPHLKEESTLFSAGLENRTPLLLGGNDPHVFSRDELRSMGEEFGIGLIEDVLDFFTGQWRDPARIRILDATFRLGESLASRLASLQAEASQAVDRQAVLLILDDSQSFRDDRVYIDPALAVASLHEYLVETGLRRKASIIVRSGAIRNLHDIMILLGFGADALNPYLLWRVAVQCADADHPPARVLTNTMQVLQKGMEKVMSTMGIHELGGYGRIFSAIGLSGELSDVFRTINFCASTGGGLNFAGLEKMAGQRYARAVAGGTPPVYREPVRNPRAGKILRQTALGKKSYLEMSREMAAIDEDMPVGIRHILSLKKAPAGRQLQPEEVDISIGGHSMPLLIAAMSFGSQGENSFRTYARAAQEADIICINGEGGEIPDMLGKYRAHRGQQIASGRFGVTMEFLNSADFLEIKIGQGAKPGEGGHLPGSKVTETVARARHCKPGTTLISPSNHHDIYSIEDLAQIITELKTANPAARVSVKIPVTSGVGTIAVGIAKAGADIVNISGFEGGTGAAREHAKRHVGLPVEVGVSQAHRALVEAGLRSEVEIWADGGIRNGIETVKMVLLGANRVGLGTVTMMAIGCISCRQCHLDRCPRGITTQMRTREEAESRGVKGYTSRQVEEEVENLVRLLKAMGDEIRHCLAEMGEKRLQDLVGRSDLLEQYRMHDLLDAGEFFAPSPALPDPGDHLLPWVVHKPLNYLTKLISDLSMARFEQGEKEINFVEEQVRSTDRAVGTYLAGAMVRQFGGSTDRKVKLRLDSSVPGNGLFAFCTAGIEGVVEGGSQDGGAKGAAGGSLAVLKGRNILGRLVDGSTGKSFAYGAIGGSYIIQNMGDSRACVRMSGAEVVVGGRITARINDRQGNIASRAHLKGFAFEYMTGGLAVVLGDPGPWICAGMTGGVIYQCLYPELDFDHQALQRRLAPGANVSIEDVNEKGLADISRLLKNYIRELENSLQLQEAATVAMLLQEAEKRFVMIVPKPLRPVSAE